MQDADNMLTEDPIGEERVTIYKKLIWWERLLANIISRNFRAKCFARKKYVDGFEQYKQRVSELIMDSAHSGIGAVTVFRRSSDHDTDVLLKSSNFFEAIVESYPTLAVKKGTTTEVENGKERQVDCIEIRWGDETW